MNLFKHLMRRTGHVHGTIVCLMDVMAVAASFLHPVPPLCGFVSMSCRVFASTLLLTILALPLRLASGSLRRFLATSVWRSSLIGLCLCLRQALGLSSSLRDLRKVKDFTVGTNTHPLLLNHSKVVRSDFATVVFESARKRTMLALVHFLIALHYITAGVSAGHTLNLLGSRHSPGMQPCP